MPSVTASPTKIRPPHRRTTGAEGSDHRGSVLPPRIGAFATDLDRTILRTGGHPTSRARRALRAVRAMGLPALLASGRPYADLARFARGFGEWDGLIAEDGAVVDAPLGRTPLLLGRRVAATVRRRLEATPALQ